MSPKLFTFVTDIQLEPILKHRVYILYISTQQCPEARDTLLLHFFSAPEPGATHFDLPPKIYIKGATKNILSDRSRTQSHDAYKCPVS